MLFLIDKSWSIGSMVIWILSTLIIGCSMIRGSKYRKSLEWSSLIVALTASIYNIISVMMTRYYNSRSLPTAVFLILSYSIYTSFAFLPGLITLRKISKQRNIKYGVLAAYFGYLWIFTMILTGLIVAIMVGKRINAYINVSFLMFGYCGLAIIIWALILLRPKITLIVYILLLTLSVVFVLVTSLASLNTVNLAYIIKLIFVEITAAVAIVIAGVFGNLWKTEPLEKITAKKV